MHPVIRYHRMLKEMTQARLARLLGISQTTLCVIESGDLVPADDLLNKIASVLDVRPAYLLLMQIPDDGEEDPMLERTK